jgi:hypothetical protein
MGRRRERRDLGSVFNAGLRRYGAPVARGRRPRRTFSHGGVCVTDFEVKCQCLHAPQKYAPMGPLSPRAIFFRPIARMAIVAALRLA